MLRRASSFGSTGNDSSDHGYVGMESGHVKGSSRRGSATRRRTRRQALMNEITSQSSSPRRTYSGEYHSTDDESMPPRTSPVRKSQAPRRARRTSSLTLGYGNSASMDNSSSHSVRSISITSGPSASSASSLLKRRQQQRSKRSTRIQRILCFYISGVLLFLGFAFVRLEKLSSTTTSRTSSSSSTSVVSAVASFWKQRQSKQQLPWHSATDQQQPALVQQPRSGSFPPPYPKQHQQSSIHLSQAALDMCTNTLWHTVETTTIVLPKNETFVHTGDIDDLWLRDSAAQVHPLLIDMGSGKALIETDPRLDRMVAGLIKRTALYIRHDPYANAFRIDDTYVFSAEQKRMGRHDLISTWNYELDSACYYMRMLYFYWKQSPNGNAANSVLRLQSVREAISIMIDLWKAEQQHENDAYPTGPLLDCLNCNKPYRYPGLSRRGKGTKTNATAGLTWTGFRPSDDECHYGYLVPANMFAVVALKYAAELATDLWKDTDLASRATQLANEIDRGIQEHAIVDHADFGKIYAYEVDGLGNSLLMDDANVPSLLSIPYLDCNYDPEIYANTRRFILSPANPTYKKGHNDLTGDIEGYGSPHMFARIPNNVWPMSIAMQALTSDSAEEKVRLTEQLVQASAGTGWMHESFDVANPSHFTRKWFCWADALYAELVLSLTTDCPEPHRKYKVLEWRDPLPPPPGGPFAAATV